MSDSKIQIYADWLWERKYDTGVSGEKIAIAIAALALAAEEIAEAIRDSALLPQEDNEDTT